MYCKPKLLNTPIKYDYKYMNIKKKGKNELSYCFLQFQTKLPNINKH